MTTATPDAFSAFAPPTAGLTVEAGPEDDGRKLLELVRTPATTLQRAALTLVSQCNCPHTHNICCMQCTPRRPCVLHTCCTCGASRGMPACLGWRPRCSLSVCELAVYCLCDHSVNSPLAFPHTRTRATHRCSGSSPRSGRGSRRPGPGTRSSRATSGRPATCA